MQIHGRAKLGPAGRLAVCEAIEGGQTFRQAAAGVNVSPATAHRWWHRYAAASLAERHSMPRRLSGAVAGGERTCSAERTPGSMRCFSARPSLAIYEGTSALMPYPHLSDRQRAQRGAHAADQTREGQADDDPDPHPGGVRQTRQTDCGSASTSYRP